MREVLMVVVVLVGGCERSSARSGAAPADATPAGDPLARAACERMVALAKDGCRAAGGITELDRCVDDVAKTHREVPESRWIAQCFVDSADCEALAACLDPSLPR